MVTSESVVSRHEIPGDSDSELTDCESTGPKPKRSQNVALSQAGAASYRTKFNTEWKKEFPFATSVSNDLYRSGL